MSEEERVLLYNWITTSLYVRLKPLSSNRLQYILMEHDRTIHPLVWEIWNRIVKKEGLENFQRETKLHDFIAYIPKNSFIHKHRDENYKQLIHSRFNVFISSPTDQFNTYYDETIVECKERCYVLCRSGIDEHYSDINTGDKPRISFSFGWLLPPTKVDELTADKSIGTYRFYPLGRNV